MKHLLKIITSIALLFVFTQTSCSDNSNKTKTQALMFSKVVNSIHIQKISTGDKMPYKTFDALLAANPGIELPEGCTVKNYSPNAKDEEVMLTIDCGKHTVKLLGNGAAIAE